MPHYFNFNSVLTHLINFYGVELANRLLIKTAHLSSTLISLAEGEMLFIAIYIMSHFTYKVFVTDFKHEVDMVYLRG